MWYPFTAYAHMPLWTAPGQLARKPYQLSKKAQTLLFSRMHTAAKVL